jgi:hypothetical protein
MNLNKDIVLLTPYPNSHRTAEENLGLGYIAQVLRYNNFNVFIFDAWLCDFSEQELIEKVISISPSIVGISCYRSNLEQVEKIIQLLRTKIKVTFICGGYGATFHDEDFLNVGVDIVVRGEAEHIIVDVINAILQKKDLSYIPNISFKEHNQIIRNDIVEPLDNLDLLPFPSRDTIQETLKRKNFVNVCTSRGCYGKCTFCSIFAFSLRSSPNYLWRQRSIKNIIEEIKYLHESFGVKHFKFVDDSFIEPPRNLKWVDEFVNCLQNNSLKIQFRTQVRADRLSSEIVKTLKEGGWFATSVGIENMSYSSLKRMNKSATVEDNYNSLSWLKENNIYVQMGMILFDYCTSIAELEDNLNFFKKNDWVITKGIFTEMFAAEGTLYTKKIRQKQKNNQLKYQNILYLIEDYNVKRIYLLLKEWHRCHSFIYDWVIDSLSSPKILPNNYYVKVADLCKYLLRKDVEFFELVLFHVKDTLNLKEFENTDLYLLDNFIKSNSYFYDEIYQSINLIYQKCDIVYCANRNPFIN